MRIKLKTILTSIALILLISMQTALAESAVERRKDNFTTRFDIFFKVLEEKLKDAKKALMRLITLKHLDKVFLISKQTMQQTTVTMPKE